MSLTMSYLTSTKNLESIFNSIIGARAPERFTTKFLEDLGFKSSTDRLFIGMLKALGLLDDSGQPTQRYYNFLDQSQSKIVIATGIQEAYEDLFNLRKDAQNMTNEDVKNKLKTLTQGQKGDRVIEQMAMTFHYATMLIGQTNRLMMCLHLKTSQKPRENQKKQSRHLLMKQIPLLLLLQK